MGVERVTVEKKTKSLGKYFLLSKNRNTRREKGTEQGK